MRRDIYNYKKRFEVAVNLIKKSDISEHNKKLIFDFLDDCRIDGAGYGSPLSLSRTTRYAYSLKKIAKWIEIDFDKANKDDIKQLVKKIEFSEKYEDSTKHIYKVTIKKFYKWLNGGEDYPECVRWIKLRNKDSKKYPWVNITEEDILAMVNVCDDSRDQSIIMALAETSGRIGEIGTPQIKHIKKWEHGFMILFDGKTGERPIPLIASAPYIANYLNSHPHKDDPEAYFWIKRNGANYGKPMNYDDFRMMLRRKAQKAGIKKRVNPHSFRHSRATKLWKILGKDPMAMNRYHGWKPDSKMWKVYLHLSGDDVQDPLLEFYGLKKKEAKVESLIKPKVCRKCNTLNGMTSVICSECSNTLDENNPMDLEQQRTLDSNATTQMFSQPDALETFVKKMIEEKLNEILQMKNSHPNMSPPLKEHAIMVSQKK